MSTARKRLHGKGLAHLVEKHFSIEHLRHAEGVPIVVREIDHDARIRRHH
jgi:hypothetical protein